MSEGRGAAGPRMVRVLVVDDQIMVREGIVLLLGLLPGIDVVGSAGDGEEALRLVAEVSPDVVLMDLRMPRCDGVEATRRIRAEHPATQVVVVTTYADDEWLFPALKAGARGYVTKDADAEEITRAIEDVMSGQAGLSPKVQRRLLERLVADTAGTAGTGGAVGEGEAGAAAGTAVKAGAVRGPLPDGLTPREAEVLALVAEGLSNAEIARRLHIGPATVKTHINNLFAKAGVRDRAQAVRYAYRSGIARPPGPATPASGPGPGLSPETGA
ncbi:response regulator [Streptomyces sp. LZ34]